MKKKVYSVKELNPAMWAIVCPDCGEILASTSERIMLPKFMFCDCPPTYTVSRSQDDGEVYCVRNTPPRFTARYSPGGETSDVVFTDFVDSLRPDPIELAKMMRVIGDNIANFLEKERDDNKR